MVLLTMDANDLNLLAVPFSPYRNSPWYSVRASFASLGPVGREIGNKRKFLFNFLVVPMFSFFLQPPCFHVMAHSYFLSTSANNSPLMQLTPGCIFFQFHFCSISAHIRQSSWPKVCVFMQKWVRKNS